MASWSPAEAEEDALLALKRERELRRLSVHEDFNLQAETEPGGTTAAAAVLTEDAPSTGALRFNTVIYDDFAVPSGAMLAWPAGMAPGAPPNGQFADDEQHQVLGYPLHRLLRLVHTVHEWVSMQKSGRIDWEAIASRMSSSRPGEAQQPLMSAADAHRLWRLLAYRMAAPAPAPVAGPEASDGGIAGEVEAQLMAAARLQRGRAQPPASLSEVELEVDSDIEEYLRSAQARDHAEAPVASRTKICMLPPHDEPQIQRATGELISVAEASDQHDPT